ncbi:3-oxoacyl-ACP reductase FabG [Psittacicella gerlachiana]|uniref:3-oxoacyl-[acyl-carrier-protein] reductase n=1 Tax=Psittacicella gerlachiana TaxID=2028574 RepID=A0A3A1Y8B3_9GAMM|nr:3-oxoacyl-ACP reductase FabG [Psittacicella gerlachiana]RIY33895.1 3-oxoacyl-ACP reductase [Psittacicella gerlachiana]
MMSKIALVTGASRGIGKAIALELASRGCTVIGTATSEAGANAITEYLNGKGEGLVLNVTSKDSQAELLKAIKEKYGDVDILVNNAGITRDKLLLRLNDQDWNDIIQTNLTPIFQLSQAVMRPMMKKGWGRIINIGSVVGLTGNVGQANYSAAKAGVIGFTKSMSLEVAGKGVTVNVVAPGFIATDMTDVLSEEVKAGILASVPAKRLGTPEEVAKAVAFLASDDASYITGHTLSVNGGMYQG